MGFFAMCFNSSGLSIFQIKWRGVLTCHYHFKNPPKWFFKSCQILLKFCTLSIWTVLWIHLLCYFDPQNLLWPSGGILTPKNVKKHPMIFRRFWILLKFCTKLLFEFWLFPGNQSYWVLFISLLLSKCEIRFCHDTQKAKIREKLVSQMTSAKSICWRHRGAKS